MGRGKLNMELITNERSRLITYHKRKKGLTKKAREFNILCDVDACVIIFGPKVSDRQVDIETWPVDRDDVMRIINRYRAEGTERKKTQDLSDFFVNRKKRVDDEIAKSRKARLEAKFPVWDNRLDFLTVDQLKALATVIDNKLEAAKVRVLHMKGNQFFTVDNSPASTGTKRSSVSDRANLVVAPSFANAWHQKNSELEVLNQQQQQQQHFSCIKQLDMHLPSYNYSQSDQAFQQMMPCSSNHSNNHLCMMLLMGGEDFNQFGNMYGGNFPCTPSKAPVYYNYDPAPEMLGNTMINNPRAHPMSYYSRTRQPMLPYSRQVPETPNFAPQMNQTHAPQRSDFGEFITEHDIGKK